MGDVSTVVNFMRGMEDDVIDSEIFISKTSNSYWPFISGTGSNIYIVTCKI